MTPYIQLLTAIQAAGDWVTRDQIAAAIQKDRLNANDLRLLDALCYIDHLVECRSNPARRSRTDPVYQYKAVTQ